MTKGQVKLFSTGGGGGVRKQKIYFKVNGRMSENGSVYENATPVHV